MNCFIINITKKKTKRYFRRQVLGYRTGQQTCLAYVKKIFVLIFLPSSNSASEIKDIRE